MQTEAQKELTRKWIEALRSGKYKQGIGYLKCEGAYCCLGVLCELQGVSQENINSFPEVAFIFDEFSVYCHTSTGNVPNSVFKDWTGFEPLTKVILISMNDGEKASFEKIADYLDKVKD